MSSCGGVCCNFEQTTAVGNNSTWKKYQNDYGVNWDCACKIMVILVQKKIINLHIPHHVANQLKKRLSNSSFWQLSHSKTAYLWM